MDLYSEMTLQARWSWGSRVVLRYNWGDGTINEKIHPDNSRRSEYLHVYQQTGTYYPTMSIANYKLDCSNQTVPLTAYGNLLPVHVLKSIQGFRISPAYFAWQRAVTFELTVSFLNGTWINLTIDWNDTTDDFLYIDSIGPNFNVCRYSDQTVTEATLYPEVTYFPTIFIGSLYARLIYNGQIIMFE